MVPFQKKSYWQKLQQYRLPLALIFFLLLCTTVWIDGYLYPGSNLIGLYLLNFVLAGIVFWRSMALQMISAALLTCFYYYFAPFRSPHISVIFFNGLTYLLATLSISYAIRYHRREKENTLNLTLVLAKSLDARDKYTAFHSENVAMYAYRIAKEMGLSQKSCERIYLGGLLHDIGKIGVPESILTKPSKLTEEEYAIVKQHPSIGYEMVKHISLFRNNGVLDAILYHHERYDGKGYPKGLAGEEIPQVARIMAIADSFDAMTSRRGYRAQTDIHYAVREIRKNKGTQFDPVIADVFLQIVEREGEDILSRREETVRLPNQDKGTHLR
ncbi:HD-GYP domain-containing protein [Brevibacillus composti]|uniref:HD-GYP domain-containing protein n=1 Tax=Brevibacillus composti TaxID=2796470 RepID=A0A7T5EIV1_9BACL|nr:HD-GYP domain-containing protein [Brevibacillus composti]QQE73383.1 HD-GYP domain-containing protein [Brevibacillus composti]QUO40464.1 HD-GYP domain-containing protein [Brevibacillus composti]